MELDYIILFFAILGCIFAFILLLAGLLSFLNILKSFIINRKFIKKAKKIRKLYRDKGSAIIK